MLTLLKHAQPQTQYILLTSPIQNQLIQHNPKEKNNRFFVLRSWRSFHVWQTLLTVEKLRHILSKIFQTNKITNVADLGQPGFLSLSSLAWKGFNAKRTFASCVFCKLRHVSTEEFFVYARLHITPPELRCEAAPSHDGCSMWARLHVGIHAGKSTWTLNKKSSRLARFPVGRLATLGPPERDALCGTCRWRWIAPGAKVPKWNRPEPLLTRAAFFGCRSGQLAAYPHSPC